MEKIEALEKVGKKLLLGEQEVAKTLINELYPFRYMEVTGRAPLHLAVPIQKKTGLPHPCCIILLKITGLWSS